MGRCRQKKKIKRGKTIKKTAKKATKITKALVPEIIPETPEISEDGYLTHLLQIAYKNPCSSIEELAKKANLPVSVVQTVEREKKVELVKLSNFKKNFAPSLILNIRNLLAMIQTMTQDGKCNCDAATLRGYTSSMKILYDMLKQTEGKESGKDPVMRRTIRVSTIMEEFYQEEKTEKAVN